MADTQQIRPRATLPGIIYKKNGHWWWKVRLPGQDRIRCRSLRAQGARVGTKSRQQAGQIALHLWEEALKAEIKKELENLSKAQICDPLPAPSDRPDAQTTGPETSDISGQAANSQRKKPDPIPPSHGCVSVVSNFGQSDWFDSLIGMDDHALCECCGREDFFEEYLKRIDSGQRLCPRCYGAFQKKARAAEQMLCA